MQNVSLAIPDDIIYEVRSMPNRDLAINEKLKIRLAIGMFVSQEISLARAAQLAGQNLVEFMDTLKGLGIPSVIYTEEMFLDDMKFVETR